MTNEERKKAIRILQWLHDNDFLFRSTEEDVKYATKLAIQELQKEPCEDAISRQAVLEYIEGSWAELGHSSENELVCQDIKELPPVTTHRKVGRWIPCSEKSPDKNERLALLYDNGLVSGGKYLGDRTYNVDFPDQNKKTRVVAWTPIQSYKVESEDKE